MWPLLCWWREQPHGGAGPVLGISPVHLLEERGCTWVLPSPTTEGQCPAARRYGCASGLGSGVFYLFVLIFRHARVGGK